jgi:hypothetical protein
MRYLEIQREATDSSCNDAEPSSSLGRTVGASMRPDVQSWCVAAAVATTTAGRPTAARACAVTRRR